MSALPPPDPDPILKVVFVIVMVLILYSFAVNGMRMMEERGHMRIPDEYLGFNGQENRFQHHW